MIIRRPVEQVFRFLLDLQSNMRIVDPDVETVTKTSGEPIGVGTTYLVHRRSRTPFGLRRRRDVVRYTAIDPNRQIESEVRFGPVAIKASFTLERANGGTRLTFRGEPNPVRPFKFLLPRLTRRGQRRWDERLARIKAFLESMGGPLSSPPAPPLT